MNVPDLRQHTLTSSLVVLLLPVAFGTGLLAAGGWTAHYAFGASLDPITRGLTVAVIVTVLAMFLVAGQHTSGGFLALASGLAGVWAALFMFGGEGDVLVTRLFPVVVVALSLAVVLLSLVWMRRTSRKFGWLDLAGIAAGLLAAVILLGAN